MGFLCNKQKTMSIPRATEGQGPKRFPEHKSKADREEQGHESTLSTAAFQDRHHSNKREAKRTLLLL